VGEGDDDFSDFRLARLMASLRDDWRVRPRAGRLPPKRASALEAYASPLQRGFNGLETADSDDPATLADDAEASIVEYCWKNADKPPKLREAGLGSWGRVSPGPRHYWGPGPGGLLARPASGLMRVSCPEARVR
jgi:hypothetical protein